MDDEIMFTPSGPDTLCDRAMVMANLAATIDVTADDEAKNLLLLAMDTLLQTMIPMHLVKEGNVVHFK